MPSISVVPVIDTSTNMANSGVATSVLQIAVNAFLGSLLTGDAVGVVNFDTDGDVAYGPNDQVAVVDSSYDQVRAAKIAVNALSFTGSSANIGGGLQAAYNLLAATGAPAPLGAVLLTPGFQSGSGSTDPLTLASYEPTYACAVGANANQTLVQQIATLSNGQFYAITTNPSLTSVLADIRSAQTGNTTLVNAYQQIATEDSWLEPVTIAANTKEAQFVVVWENPAFTYTSSSNPSSSQVSITLVQPPGITSTTAPTVQGTGFVVFDVTSPASGLWYVQIMYPGTTAPLTAAIAVFEIPSSTVSALRLDLEAPQRVQPGRPTALTARVTDGGEPVRGLRMTAEVVAPRPSDGGIPGSRTYKVPLVAREDGTHSLSIDSRESGGYLVKVHVQGYAERSATHFERTRIVSFVIE